MQAHLRPKYIVIMPLPLLITILIITSRISIPLLLLHAQAENVSPSFARQEVNDEIHDVKQFAGIESNSNNSRQKTNDYYNNNNNNNPLSESVDIERISYSSDGNFLNATLWVGGNGVNENPLSYGANMIAYGMVIDADNNGKTKSRI
jgi:ABC-type bacteriocin/lantibiotic exporter with double-glycine peptidase domain